MNDASRPGSTALQADSLNGHADAWVYALSVFVVGALAPLQSSRTARA